MSTASRHLTVSPTIVPAGAVKVPAAADDPGGVFFPSKVRKKLQSSELKSRQEGSTHNPECY